MSVVSISCIVHNFIQTQPACYVYICENIKEISGKVNALWTTRSMNQRKRKQKRIYFLSNDIESNQFCWVSLYIINYHSHYFIMTKSAIIFITTLEWNWREYLTYLYCTDNNTDHKLYLNTERTVSGKFKFALREYFSKVSDIRYSETPQLTNTLSTPYVLYNSLTSIRIKKSPTRRRICIYGIWANKF